MEWPTVPSHQRAIVAVSLIMSYCEDRPSEVRPGCISRVSSCFGQGSTVAQLFQLFLGHAEIMTIFVEDCFANLFLQFFWIDRAFRRER